MRIFERVENPRRGLSTIPNWRRILAVMRKEWWHITRDRISFGLLILSPVLVLVTMGYAFSVDIEDVDIAVLDQDLSAFSREYLAQVTSDDGLRLQTVVESLNDVESLMMRGRTKAVIIIPHGFARDLKAGDQAAVQVIVDGTDPHTAGHALRHIGEHTDYFATSYLKGRMRRRGANVENLSPVGLRFQAWYNPLLRYTVSIVPALVGVVLSVPAMAASLTLARERERGTLEALIATPIGRVELLVGKLVPYMLAGFCSVPLCIATAVYGYGIAFRGNIGIYLALCMLFLFATMSIALFLSIFAGSQQVAIIGSMIIFLFSGFFLSGLLIPFALMGPLVKLEAFFFPTTHFVIISRGFFVKGVGLRAVYPYVLALAVLGVIFLALATLTFKKKIS
ncbi:MAG: ABC transporter permease [Anaerolineales bacterium]